MIEEKEKHLVQDKVEKGLRWLAMDGGMQERTVEDEFRMAERTASLRGW